MNYTTFHLKKKDKKNRRRPIKNPFLNSSNEAGELQVIFTIFCLKKFQKRNEKKSKFVNVSNAKKICQV